jgi:predicted glycosyltransferase
MFYCHDTYGLGHLRRALTLGTYLRDRCPEMTQLIVTGLPLPHRFQMPDGVDYVKLPSIQRIGPEQDDAPYVARSLNVPFSDIRDLRQEILLAAARRFAPDALIVDVMPVGVKGELIPTLRYLKTAPHPARLIFGMRDMLDDPPLIHHAYARDGVYEDLDVLYDLVLVYGQQDVYDVVREYRLPPRVAAKTRFVGYLRRDQAEQPPAAVRAQLGLQTGRLVLITVGGGVDGYAVLQAMLEAIHGAPDAVRFDCMLVTGPLMSDQDRERLQATAPADGRVRLVEFVDDMIGLIAAADVVVSMAGYNTVCEILSNGRPAILIPRTAKPTEQFLRAEALSRRGLVRMIDPAELTPRRLLREVNDLLDHPPLAEAGLMFDGLPAVAAELDALLSSSAA